jgi:hypothetical protein
MFFGNLFWKFILEIYFEIFWGNFYWIFFHENADRSGATSECYKSRYLIVYKFPVGATSRFSAIVTDTHGFNAFTVVGVFSKANVAFFPLARAALGLSLQLVLSITASNDVSNSSGIVFVFMPTWYFQDFLFLIYVHRVDIRGRGHGTMGEMTVFAPD